MYSSRVLLTIITNYFYHANQQLSLFPLLTCNIEYSSLSLKDNIKAIGLSTLLTERVLLEMAVSGFQIKSGMTEWLDF